MLATLSLAVMSAQTQADAISCQRKIDEIKNDRAKPGSVYVFTPQEVTAWARKELPKEVPEGIRDPRAEFGVNSGTGSAMVDFLKMRHAQGAKPGWLLEKLIAGERPIRIGVELKTANGQATVYLRSVQISGISASGTVLDYLIRTFFRPLYPEAHINEPFEMSHNVERVEVRPEAARVYIKAAAKPSSLPKPLVPKRR